VDRTIGRNGRLFDAVKGLHQEAKGVAMPDVFSVELVEDSKTGLGALVVSSFELSCQI
jgi:hypothetical protein